MNIESIRQTLDAIAQLRGFTDLTEEEDRLEYTNDDGARKLLVIFAQIEVGKADVHPFLAAIEEAQATEGIVVVPRKITSGALKEIQKHPLPIHVFLHSELVFNVLTHEYCPRYEVVPAEQHATVFATFATADKLPRLRKDDPVARYMGLQKDAVVKVVTHSDITTSSVHYVVVV
jgi:DNA-directed RNA polymerase I, II, and III subunit RPABC1